MSEVNTFGIIPELCVEKICARRDTNSYDAFPAPLLPCTLSLWLQWCRLPWQPSLSSAHTKEHVSLPNHERKLWRQSRVSSAILGGRRWCWVVVIHLFFCLFSSGLFFKGLLLMSDMHPGDEIQSKIYTYELSGPPFGSPHLWRCYHLWIKGDIPVDTSSHCPLVFVTDQYTLEMVWEKTTIQMT